MRWQYLPIMTGKKLCLNLWRFAFHGPIDEEAACKDHAYRDAVSTFVYNVERDFVYCDSQSLWICGRPGIALATSLGTVLDGGISGGVVCASTGAQVSIIDRRKALKQAGCPHPPIWISDC